MKGFSIDEQVAEFKRLVLLNPVVTAVLQDPPFTDGTPWYITSGVLYQTIWNSITGRDLLEGMKDCDLIYFEADLSAEKELATQSRISEKYKHLALPVEAINQARVHVWHPTDYYGYQIDPPYTSCEDALSRWPSSVVAIGITNAPDGGLKIYAPFGLHDIFAMVCRPNIGCGLRKMFEGKSRKLKKKWPEVTVIPWEFEVPGDSGDRVGR